MYRNRDLVLQIEDQVLLFWHLILGGWRLSQNHQVAPVAQWRRRRPPKVKIAGSKLKVDIPKQNLPWLSFYCGQDAPISPLTARIGVNGPYRACSRRVLLCRSAPVRVVTLPRVGLHPVLYQLNPFSGAFCTASRHTSGLRACSLFYAYYCMYQVCCILPSRVYKKTAACDYCLLWPWFRRPTSDSRIACISGARSKDRANR